MNGKSYPLGINMETTQTSAPSPQQAPSLATVTPSFFSIIVQRVKHLLVEPTAFFEQSKSEKGIKQAFLTYAALLAVGYFLRYLVELVFATTFASQQFLSFLTKATGYAMPTLPTTTQSPDPVATFLLYLGFYAWMLVWVFGFAGILFVWSKIWGCAGTYTDSFKLLVYSRVPSQLLGWIPGVGFFTWIYTLILLIIGAQKLYGSSRTKSIWMFVVPIILSILLFVGVFALGVFLFVGMKGQ